ncbi:FAD/NAD(P)-binding protein [Immundisolibacter sp.]|uniref:FAD/NAD(P)-binding protein n=1 Tax=Immundisolibacter sp. TaxID=1934948 RepID=UPI003F84294B
MSAAAEAQLPAPWRITQRRQDTADVFTWIVAPLAEAGISCAPGQFNMVYAYGIGEVPISIAGVDGDGALQHTIRAVGSVTRALAGLAAGTVIGLRGPYGSAWPLEAAAGGDLVIVAGGLGLAPLRQAIVQVLAQRERYGRVCILYGTRTPADVLYGGELAAWAAHRDVEFAITVDRASAGWGGEVGVVTRLVARAGFDPERTTALVCGPEIMMRFTAEALLRRGVAPAAIHVSLERNMKCAVGYCGHCQLGPHFICRDGPVLPWPRLAGLLEVPEL